MLRDLGNSSTHQLAYNPVRHQRPKLIDIKYHWIRDMVVDYMVELVYVTGQTF